jgi:peptidoglycan/xylan/chitin deacetylase (PgdA/CDA1 family)
MPYFITDSSPDCDVWATIKEDGEVIGCHTTKQEAIDQMVAVSIAEEIEPGGERIKKKKMKTTYRVLPDNYRPSLSEDVPEGRACGNCIFYKEDDVKEFADGELRAWCEKWDDYVNGAYYCNAWQMDEESRAPAPKKEQIKGSETNEPGSAKGSGADIVFSEATTTALKNKVSDHNERMTQLSKPDWTRTTLGTLKSVYRRGSGAYSTSFRPGVSRAAWSMARVNAFLYLLRNGRPANAKYVTDNDLLPSGHPKSSRTVDAIDFEERQVNLTPPAYMRAAARRGLELNRQGFGGDGLTDKTKQEARDMADGRVSEDKWRRIGPWIARHLVDLDAAKNSNPDDSDYPGAGLVAHLLWGSGPSKRAAQRTLDYAQGVVERLDMEERHGTHDQSSHGNWSGGGGTGKNLLEDGTLQKGNALDQSLSAKTSKYNTDDFINGKSSQDSALKEIADKQGFSGQAQRASSQDEYDAIDSPKIESGPLKGQNVIGQKELHRGFRDSGDKKVSAETARNEFESGEYFAGKGIVGNGIYVSPRLDTAQGYAQDESVTNVSSFKLDSNAKIGSYSQIVQERNAIQSELPDSVYNDIGRYAAAKGLDGYVMDISPATGSNILSSNITQLVILNRTAIVLPPKG